MFCKGTLRLWLIKYMFSQFLKVGNLLATGWHRTFMIAAVVAGAQCNEWAVNLLHQLAFIRVRLLCWWFCPAAASLWYSAERCSPLCATPVVTCGGLIVSPSPPSTLPGPGTTSLTAVSSCTDRLSTRLRTAHNLLLLWCNWMRNFGRDFLSNVFKLDAWLSIF